MHVGAVLSQRNFFVEGEACGGTRRRAVDARSWPFFTLSSLVLYLARLFLGGVAIFNGFCVLVNHSPRTWQLRQFYKLVLLLLHRFSSNFQEVSQHTLFPLYLESSLRRFILLSRCTTVRVDDTMCDGLLNKIA